MNVNFRTTLKLLKNIEGASLGHSEDDKKIDFLKVLGFLTKTYQPPPPHTHTHTLYAFLETPNQSGCPHLKMKLSSLKNEPPPLKNKASFQEIIPRKISKS